MPSDNSDDTQGESIRTLFDKAESLKQSLDSHFSSNDPAYQTDLRAAISHYERCKKLIDQASLFSMNESLDDLATSDMRYLATDFNLAELILKANGQDRKTALERAKEHYKAFIYLCEAYELLSKENKKAVESAASANVSTSYLPSDPAARRETKIAQFREEKELRRKLEALSASRNADDESVRNFCKTSISLAVMQTIQSLEMLKMEMDILAKAPPPTEAPSSAESPAGNDQRIRGAHNIEYNDKLDIGIGAKIRGGALLSKDGKPLRPFVLLNQREQLRAGVFRPSHNLPTMTIDEYLEEERRRGGIIEGGGEKSGERPEPNEDDIEAADRATMKAREWDEFVEEHPRGSGNTLNRG